MHLDTWEWLAMVFLWPHIVAASPLPSLVERQVDMDCDNPAAIYMSECWGALNLGDYLAHWNQTTPVCADSAHCCINGEAWSTCFLRLARNSAGQNCLTVDSPDCVWQDKSISVDPSIFPQVRYVFKSIYGVYGFFSTYATAQQASLMITPLTAAIDPKGHSNMVFNLVMIFLCLGLSFLTAPTAGLEIINLESKAIAHSAQSFALSLQQAPNVARAILPSDGSDWSRTIQISALQTQLQNMTSLLEGTFDRSLGLVMSDVPTFIGFAQSGAFCNNQTMDINNRTDYLDLALRTYITGASMQQNDWYAIPEKILTEAEYKNLTNPTCANPSQPHGCVTVDIVGETYWSPVTGRTYRLQNKSHYTVAAPSLLDQIRSQKWADMATLFDGAYNCTASGRAGDINSTMQIDYDGTLNTACLSQLPIYIGCSSTCPDTYQAGVCPFGTYEDCRPQNNGNLAVHGGVGSETPATPLPAAVSHSTSTTPPAIQPAATSKPQPAGMVQIH
ncbi:MAG: hypothetical protein Q9191_007833 [Dirinaria sp. TL-2023a]